MQARLEQLEGGAEVEVGQVVVGLHVGALAAELDFLVVGLVVAVADDQGELEVDLGGRQGRIQLEGEEMNGKMHGLVFCGNVKLLSI